MHDAVAVRVIGDSARPAAIEVSLVTLDAGAFETRLEARPIARIPGASIPAETILTSAPARYGQAGWLALGLANATSVGGSILIVDIRTPDAPAWSVPGQLEAAAWGPGSVLAVADDGRILLHDASDRSSARIDLAPDLLGDSVGGADVPPVWLADGQGFLGWRGEIDRQFGRLDLDGTFSLTDTPAATFQSAGRERRWGRSGEELSVACPTEGGPEGCSIAVGVGGGAPVAWFTEGFGGGRIQDVAWDAAGTGVWALLEHVTGEGPVAYSLSHAGAPDDWLEVVSTPLDSPLEGGLAIQGLQDADPTLDGRNLIIGPRGGAIQVVISGDGAMGSLADDHWFAGWAADQGAYPTR